MVDDGTEGQATPPAGSHVQDVHVGIASSDLLAPGLQGLGPRHGHVLPASCQVFQGSDNYHSWLLSQLSQVHVMHACDV